MKTLIAAAILIGIICASLQTGDAAPVTNPPKDEITLKDIPPWANQAGFKAEPCIATAIKLQALGKDKAYEKLLELADIGKVAKALEAKLKADGLTGDPLRIALYKQMSQEREQREGIFVLCRMLFTAKAGGTFRPARLGAPVYVGYYNSFLVDEAPLEPIEIVDGVPFMIVHGYNLGGEPEALNKYLKYCIEECDWNPTKFKPKTAIEKQKALTKLISFLKFRGNVPDYEVEFLSSQIK